MNGNYILDENSKPVLEQDLQKWAEWFEKANRVVGKTEVGGILISTVFLGTDHNWEPGPPVLWETMVFGEAFGDLDHQSQRWTSLEQAKAGHEKWVAKVRQQLAKAVTT